MRVVMMGAWWSDRTANHETVVVNKRYGSYI